MKKTIIAVMIIAGFVFAVSFSTLYVQTHIVEGTACTCTLPISLLIPTFSSLGILVGSFVYYLMFSKFEEVKEESSANISIMLELLNPIERKVLQKLIENGGRITQSSLSRELGKVKAFRIVETLRRRNVVEKKKYGKTNMIVLTEKFSNILLS